MTTITDLRKQLETRLDDWSAGARDAYSQAIISELDRWLRLLDAVEEASVWTQCYLADHRKDTTYIPESDLLAAIHAITEGI